MKNSQRIYQKDNILAYIIQYYNDKLDNDSLVINIKSNDKFTVKKLLELIKEYNK